jgi:outer membrane PBP1 activator LpoA protein
MTKCKAGLWVVVITAAALIIGGCATHRAGGPTKPANPARVAQQAAATSHYRKAVQSYVQAANQASDPQQQRQYRFEAGLAAAQGGDVQSAQQLLASINPDSLNKTDQARYKLAQREIKIADLAPAEALSRLPRPNRDTAPAVAQRNWEKRADLLFADDDLVKGIHALVQRDGWLMNDRTRHANDKRIYAKSLDAISLGIGPDSRAAADSGQTTRGWLALAQIGQRRFADQQARNQALADWQDQYPDHPANRAILAERFHYSGAQVSGQARGQAGPAPQISSAQVAIALPLSGQFKNAAQAIRDGFMFAYQHNPDDMPRPLIYDSNATPPESLIDQANSDNVGILVGPLLKSKVAAMARASASLPEIALNITHQVTPRPGFYQFGLTPEDDARSAAAHAARADYSQALALVPKGDWGDRVLGAFSRALTARGGSVVNHQAYNGSSHDHSRAIKALLQNQDDADFIFVAAQPVQARLIRSQLKYYRAGNLPMITTSHAYSGVPDPGKDIDLNGVHFVDIPWLLGQGGTITRLRNEAINAYKAEATQFTRPFAFGMDGWLLARRLYHDRLSRQQPIEGMTGVLTLQPNGEIRRHLGWAVFRDGRPHTLAMPSPDEALTADSYRADNEARQSQSDQQSGSNPPAESDKQSSAADANASGSADD